MLATSIKAELDAGSDCLAGDPVAIDHDAAIHGRGSELLQEVARRPVRGSFVALE